MQTETLTGSYKPEKRETIDLKSAAASMSEHLPKTYCRFSFFSSLPFLREFSVSLVFIYSFVRYLSIKRIQIFYISSATNKRKRNSNKIFPKKKFVRNLCFVFFFGWEQQKLSKYCRFARFTTNETSELYMNWCSVGLSKEINKIRKMKLKQWHGFGQSV